MRYFGGFENSRKAGAGSRQIGGKPSECQLFRRQSRYIGQFSGIVLKKQGEN